mgnify:CR=1 FL=1
MPLSPYRQLFDHIFSPVMQAQQGFYFVGKNLSSLVNQKFFQLIGEYRAVPQEVEVVMGRTLRVCTLLWIFIQLGVVYELYSLHNL